MTTYTVHAGPNSIHRVRTHENSERALAREGMERARALHRPDLEEILGYWLSVFSQDAPIHPAPR